MDAFSKSLESPHPKMVDPLEHRKEARYPSNGRIQTVRKELRSFAWPRGPRYAGVLGRPVD